MALAGRPFRIRSANSSTTSPSRSSRRASRNLRKALLVLAFADRRYWSASRTRAQIFTAAKHPKSFVSLAGADHLLSQQADAVYVAK